MREEGEGEEGERGGGRESMHNFHLGRREEERERERERENECIMCKKKHIVYHKDSMHISLKPP